MVLFHSRKPLIQCPIKGGESLMVHPQEVLNRRMQVAHMAAVFHCFKPQFIGGPDRLSPLLARRSLRFQTVPYSAQNCLAPERLG